MKSAAQISCRGKKILIRADASDRIGSGHVMRCLALAQAFLDAGGEATFVSAELPAALRTRLAAEGCGVIHWPGIAGSDDDARFLKETAVKSQADFLVADLFEPRPGYFPQLASGSTPVVLIDDNAAHAPYSGTVLLNPNAHAESLCYPRSEFEGGCLLGPRHVLLRREIENYPQTSSGRQDNTLLVTLGGGRIADMLGPIMTALRQTSAPFEGRISITCSQAESAVVSQVIRESGCADRCGLAIDPPDFARALATASRVISNAGTTLWECLFMRKICLAVVSAPNQEAGAQALLAEQPWAPIWFPSAGLPDLAGKLDAFLRATEATVKSKAAGTAAVLQTIIERISKVERPAKTR